MEYNKVSLDTVCAALCYAMGIEPPEHCAEPNETIKKYIDEKLNGGKADRIFMFNPDAIAQWIAEKYPLLLEPVSRRCEIQVPLLSVMPSVTPVCFGTMYTGAQPEVHGIKRYEKPVIKIDSIFDALIRAGKRPAIIAETDCSMAEIYRERDMDDYICNTIEEIDAVAARLIREDKYDFIAVYNGNYDTLMHKYGPESAEALSQLRANSLAFGIFYELIKESWKQHRTLIGFAMDHGCHEIDGSCGSHGLDMPEDLNIRHYYTLIG